MESRGSDYIMKAFLNSTELKTSETARNSLNLMIEELKDPRYDYSNIDPKPRALSIS